MREGSPRKPVINEWNTGMNEILGRGSLDEATASSVPWTFRFFENLINFVVAVKNCSCGCGVPTAYDYQKLQIAYRRWYTTFPHPHNGGVAKNVEAIHTTPR